jgi:hypothetical protein
MRRATSVVLLAVLTAALSGIDDISSAQQTQTTEASEAQRQKIAARLKGITLGSMVRIELADGEELEGVLEEVTADTISVITVENKKAVTQTLSIADIRDIERTNSGRLRKALRVAGITAAVVVGVCGAIVIATL